jgi:phage terminase small subunit
MPVLKNPRHERFAQFMAEGKTCVDAYQMAGFKRDDGNSSRLLSARPEIQARLQELTERLEARAAKRHEITTDSLVAEIERGLGITRD